MKMPAIETPDGLLTAQDAFNRAWNGLKGQNWAKSTFKKGGGCSYDGPNGTKCAWGWVDPEGTKDDPARVGDPQLSGTVRSLRDHRIGLAQYIPPDIRKDQWTCEDHPFMKFATKLQQAHDDGVQEGQWAGQTLIKDNMIALAKEYGLTIPE